MMCVVLKFRVARNRCFRHKTSALPSNTTCASLLLHGVDRTRCHPSAQTSSGTSSNVASTSRLGFGSTRNGTCCSKAAAIAAGSRAGCDEACFEHDVVIRSACLLSQARALSRGATCCSPSRLNLQRSLKIDRRRAWAEVMVFSVTPAPHHEASTQDTTGDRGRPASRKHRGSNERHQVSSRLTAGVSRRLSRPPSPMKPYTAPRQLSSSRRINALDVKCEITFIMVWPLHQPRSSSSPMPKRSRQRSRTLRPITGLSSSKCQPSVSPPTDASTGCEGRSEAVSSFCTAVAASCTSRSL